MRAARGLTLVTLALALGACELSIEVDPGDGLEQEGGRTPGQWRAEARSLEQRVASLEQEIERKREQKWALPASFDPAVEAQEEMLEQQLEQLEAQLEEAQDQLASLEDQARQADVPPGWLR